MMVRIFERLPVLRSGSVSPRRRFAIMVLLGLVGLPALGEAAGLTVAWNANGESDLAGYAVRFRSQDGAEQGEHLIAFGTTWARVEGLRVGHRYYFSVQAYNTAGMRSNASPEVSGVASNSIPVPPGAMQTYFAEGAAGFFSYQIALLNTSGLPVTVNVTYLREQASPVAGDYYVPPYGRASAASTQTPGLANTGFGAIVTAAPGVVAERTMRWTYSTADGAHTARALPAPSTEWNLAEGATGQFDTFVLFANPGTAASSVTADFLLEDGQTVRRTFTLNPAERYTIWANAIPELYWRAFATSVRSSSPILVERAMYFRGWHGAWEGGHGSAGVTAGSTRWFLAEGATGDFFETFVLLSNPHATAVTAAIRYLTPAGLARTETRSLPPTSRTTIQVDALPGVGSTEVSFDISASRAITVERSMYWGPPGAWHSSHNSVGVPALGTRWAMAEGEVGGPDAAETFVLLANPGDAAAAVMLTYHREDGRTFAVQRTVPARARISVSASSLGPLQSGERFGVVVDSSQPIAVERSVYYNRTGFWSSGTNETALRLQ